MPTRAAPVPCILDRLPLGNVLVQARARARGLIAGDLETLRALVARTQDVRRYEPRATAVRRRA